MNSQKIFAAAIMLVITVGAFAQQGWHVGVAGAYQGSFIIHQNNNETLNGTTVNPKACLAYKFTPGYSFGIVGGYNFNAKYGIVSGIYYTQGGQHYADTYTPGPEAAPVHVERNVDLTYIQIPILFKYNFGPYKKRFQFHAQAGPEVGFLVMPKEQVWINGAERFDLSPANGKFKRVDLGVTAALGMDYYFNPRFYFETEIKGFVSIMDINSKAQGESNWYGNNNVTYRNSYNLQPSVEVSIHYLFNKMDTNPFKKKQGAPIMPDKSASMR